MYLDKGNEFSDGQAITATAASENYIDAGAAGDAIPGAWLVVRVGNAFNTLTSLNIALQTDAANSFDTGPTTLLDKDVVLADLTANTTVMKVKMPLGLKQYIRLNYTVDGTPPTTGTLDAFLTPDVQAGHGE